MRDVESLPVNALDCDSAGSCVTRGRCFHRCKQGPLRHSARPALAMPQQVLAHAAVRSSATADPAGAGLSAARSSSRSWPPSSARRTRTARYGSPTNDVRPVFRVPTTPVRSNSTGTVSVTHDGEDAHMSSEDDGTKEYPCLIRVTDGDETKFSTKVSVNAPYSPQL